MRRQPASDSKQGHRCADTIISAQPTLLGISPAEPALAALLALPAAVTVAFGDVLLSAAGYCLRPHDWLCLPDSPPLQRLQHPQPQSLRSGLSLRLRQSAALLHCPLRRRLRRRPHCPQESPPVWPWTLARSSLMTMYRCKSKSSECSSVPYSVCQSTAVLGGTRQCPRRALAPGMGCDINVLLLQQQHMIQTPVGGPPPRAHSFACRRRGAGPLPAFGGAQSRKTTSPPRPS